MCSAQFTRDAFAEAWAKVRAQWPAHIAAAGIDSSGAGGFPAEWERGIALLDKLAATPGSFTEYYDKCAKIWASRVQTVRAAAAPLFLFRILNTPLRKEAAAYRPSTATSTRGMSGRTRRSRASTALRTGRACGKVTIAIKVQLT